MDLRVSTTEKRLQRFMQLVDERLNEVLAFVQFKEVQSGLMKTILF